MSVCLCAAVALLALTAVRLLGPEPALAASGTLNMETPLHESPAHGAPLVALLPEGTVVSIDGPPVDGFYPVSAAGLSGWMRGETLVLEKDVVEEVPVAGDVPADPAATGDLGAVPVAQTATDQPIPNDAMSSDTTVDPALAKDANAQLPATDPLAAAPAPAPVADQTLVAPMASPSDPASAPAMIETQPIPADAAVPETATDMTVAATPVPAAPGSETATKDATAPKDVSAAEPAADPNVTPVPQPQPAPLGPASVTVDAPIRSGPAGNYDLIFTVPNGSTVEQTGNVVDGYVTVQYKEVTGWLALEHLGQAIAFVAETPPPQTAEPIEQKTPRAGSGVAYTTVDMSLRAGPSANEEPVTVVPAGSRVILTGVMEGEFQRVTYHDQIGWVSNEYLTTPEDPEPNRGNGKQDNYSRQQIVRIIYDAADRFDQSRSAMLRVAECESNLDPYAVNPSGSYGLFQFIRSTWRSTPYGDQDIFDPRANANAAAWMWSEGRKSEWVCQ